MKLDKAYVEFLTEIKKRIQSARTRAVRAVSHEQIRHYFDIGKMIAERQEKYGWGKSIVERRRLICE